MGSFHLFRGAALLTVTGICSQIFGFFYRIALSRLIGAENMGLFQLVMPVYSLLLSLTAVGLNATVSTLTARRLALGDRAGVKTLTDRCISWFLLFAGSMGCLLALGSDFVSVSILVDARTQLSLILLVPCLLLTGVENLQKHYFYGTGTVRIPALLDLIEQGIRITAVLALLTHFLPQNPERTIGLILCGMVICEIFSACAMTFFFRRSMRDVTIRPEPGLGRRVATVAIPIAGTALLNNLLGSADAILIPRLLVAGGSSVSQSMQEYGVLFGMTFPLICLPTAFIGSLGMTLTPEIPRLMAKGQFRAAAKTLDNCLRLSGFILYPILAFLAAVGPELGAFLYKEPTAGRFLLPLAVGVALNARQALLACTLNGMGKQKTAAFNCLISDGVQLLFTVGTVKTMGLKGYLIGYLICSLLALILNHRAAAHPLGPLPLFSFLPAAFCSLLLGLCVHTLFHVLLNGKFSLFPALGICILFALLLCFVFLFTFGALPSRRQKNTRR